MCDIPSIIFDNSDYKADLSIRERRVFFYPVYEWLLTNFSEYVTPSKRKHRLQ